MATERDDDLEPDESEAALEVEVRTDNLEAGAGLVTPKDHAGYLDWLGRRQGLLGTLRSQEGEITLQGDGEGGVLIGGAWDGSRGPFSVIAALQQLDDGDVFDRILRSARVTGGRATLRL